MYETIDIWMVTHQRKEMTTNAINYLFDRTDYPYRLFVVDNGSNDGTTDILDNFVREGKVFLPVNLQRNVGIHMAHNIGLSLVESSFCISTDNDIYVPDLRRKTGFCWLTNLVRLFNNRPYYGALSCTPHAMLGAGELKPVNGVAELNMAGAVMRIMKTELVRELGGWQRHFDAKRNHEERTICDKMKNAGYKVGYATDITCYHDYGDDNNWGYKELHPHTHGHRVPGDEIWPMPIHLQIKDKLNHETWEAL